MLENQLLISMPKQTETVFDKVVVYVCEHNMQGTVGLIVNCATEYRLDFIFEQLNIESNAPQASKQTVFFGGPVQQDRGFVLHRPFEGFNANLVVNNEICVSTSKEILKCIAKGNGPKDALVTLGYAGWEAEQLEKEIRDNLWLTCDADENILYNVPVEKRWQTAIDSLGFDVSNLITTAGHA